MPVLGVVADVLPYPVDVVNYTVEIADRQAPLAQLVIPAGLSSRGFRAALHRADTVQDQAEWPGRRDSWILLPQRAGGGITRVDVWRLPSLLLPLVQLMERRDRQEHLAPDLKRARPAGSCQPGRHGADGADIGGHVLPGDPVAAGRGPGQHPAEVDQIDREPVD